MVSLCLPVKFVVVFACVLMCIYSIDATDHVVRTTKEKFDEDLLTSEHIFCLFTNNAETHLEFTRAISLVPTAFSLDPRFLLFDVSHVDVQWWNIVEGRPVPQLSVLPSLHYLNKKNNRWMSYSTITANAMLRFICKRLKLTVPIEASVLVEAPLSVPPATVSGLTRVGNVEAVPLPSPGGDPRRTLKGLHDIAALSRRFYRTAASADRGAIMDQMRNKAGQLHSLPFGTEFVHVPVMHVKTADLILSKGNVYAEQQIQRLTRLLSGGGVDEVKMLELTQKLEVFRDFTTSIPSVVHFIKTDPMTDNFKIVHYLSIRSAAERIRPDRLLFHCVVEPRGYFWEKLRSQVPQLEVIVSEAPRLMGTKSMRLAAHQSDAWRLKLLLEQGGIYLDWDVIVTHSFDDLLDNAVVFGSEKIVSNMLEVMGVAVIMSRPQTPFLKRWKVEMEDTFDGEKCYACHSTVLSRRLAIEHPEEVRVLSHYSFYHPGWEGSAFEELFAVLPHPTYSPLNQALADRYFNQTYAVHLFESGQFFQPYLPTITESNIRTVDSYFNLLVRPLL